MYQLFVAELLQELIFIYQPFQSHTQLSHNHSSRFVVVVDKLVVVVGLDVDEVFVVEEVEIVVVGLGVVVVDVFSAAI